MIDLEAPLAASAACSPNAAGPAAGVARPSRELLLMGLLAFFAFALDGAAY